MDDHLSGPRGDRSRSAEIIGRLKEDWDREVEKLKKEDPDWVKELLDRLS
jgi:hypothetical protein